MSKEELDGNDKPVGNVVLAVSRVWHGIVYVSIQMCAKCKQKRACSKKFSIQKCPEVLVLHLKRFSQSRGRSKLTMHVDFPLTNLKLSALTDVMSDSHEGSIRWQRIALSHARRLFRTRTDLQSIWDLQSQWYALFWSLHRRVQTSIDAPLAYIQWFKRSCVGGRVSDSLCQRIRVILSTK